MPSIYLKRLYALLALIAFILCWYQNLAYFHLGLIEGLKTFIHDMFANPAASSIAYDIILFFMSAAVFMWIEGRRLKIPHLWAYFVFGLIIAISVTFPLFLIARENRLNVKKPVSLI